MLDVLYELKHSHIEREAIAKTSIETLIECTTTLIDVILEEHDQSEDYVLHDLESYIAAKMYELKISTHKYEIDKLETIIELYRTRIDNLMIENFNLSHKLIDQKDKIDKLKENRSELIIAYENIIAREVNKQYDINNQLLPVLQAIKLITQQIKDPDINNSLNHVLNNCINDLMK